MKRQSPIKTFADYRNDHLAQLQAYIDNDCLPLVVERGEQPKPYIMSFTCDNKESFNHNGSHYDWYQFNTRARYEVCAYNVVITIAASNGTVKAYVDLANGGHRKIELGEYGAGESFTWITNKLARELRGNDEHIIYFDDELDFWHVIKNDSFFVNSLTHYMFNGCHYQD